MSVPNRVRQQLARGEIVLGTTAGLAVPESVEAAAAAGYAFAQIDGEHQYLSPDLQAGLIRAALGAGLCPVMRLPDDNSTALVRALDYGATGVLVPHVETAAQAAGIVRACKYGPWGSRNVGARVRTAAFEKLDRQAYSEFANADTLVWILVESVAGVKNLDEILQVEGVDAVFAGPGDLAQQLGRAGEVRHPSVVELVEEIYAKCQQNDVTIIGSQAWEPHGIRGAVAHGARIIVSGSDRTLLAGAYKATYERARDDLTAATAGELTTSRSG